MKHLLPLVSAALLLGAAPSGPLAQPNPPQACNLVSR